MKTNFYVLIVTFVFFTGNLFAQQLTFPSDDGPGNSYTANGITRVEGIQNTPSLRSGAIAAAIPVTTADNENNVLTGISDGDLDVYLFNTNSLAFIEYNIFIDDAVVTTAQLSILAYDIDWSSGEQDGVYINGHFVGNLTGANG